MAQAEQSFFSFHDTLPLSKLEEIARNDLGETEELKEKCLKDLRKLIKDCKVNCPSTDDFLLCFLRVKKFDTQRSFESLRNYAKQRALLHKSFLELRPEALEICIRRNIFGFLPYRDAEGRAIYFLRPGSWNADVCSPEEFLTIDFLLWISALGDESLQTTGIVFIIHLETLPFSQWLHFTRLVHRWKDFFFNCYPARYSALHVVGKSACIKCMQMIVFPFVPKKIANRIAFHEEFGETLFKYIPATILPDIFGGKLGPVNNDHITKVMKDHLQRVKNEHHYFQQDY